IEEPDDILGHRFRANRGEELAQATPRGALLEGGEEMSLPDAAWGDEQKEAPTGVASQDFRPSRQRTQQRVEGLRRRAGVEALHDAALISNVRQIEVMSTHEDQAYRLSVL